MPLADIDQLSEPGPQSNQERSRGHKYPQIIGPIYFCFRLTSLGAHQEPTYFLMQLNIIFVAHLVFLLSCEEGGPTMKKPSAKKAMFIHILWVPVSNYLAGCAAQDLHTGPEVCEPPP